ncbi:unnamed protein product [Protopolystoma xenopodis]|uniref:Uncharacterized protein n=1 Tax=Protopolystoma xenopodis TaxID=117903 RepID=A0A3S5BM59_9PLAT|nr:unnamed protein product [Protopolystoma xenopodis]
MCGLSVDGSVGRSMGQPVRRQRQRRAQAPADWCSRCGGVCLGLAPCASLACTRRAEAAGPTCCTRGRHQTDRQAEVPAPRGTDTDRGVRLSAFVGPACTACAAHPLRRGPSRACRRTSLSHFTYSRSNGPHSERRMTGNWPELDGKFNNLTATWRPLEQNNSAQTRRCVDRKLARI